MMGIKTFLALATLGLVAAESSVTSLFLYDVNPEKPQHLVGSVMAVDADTTTYSINCAKTVDTNSCAYLPGLLYTAGPTTIEYALKAPYDRSGTMKCSLGGTTTADCTFAMPTTGTNTMAPQTTALGEDRITFEKMSVTAGATATSTGSSSTKAGDDAKSTGTSSDESSANASGSSSSSTGAMPRITANPGIALGGAAAAFFAAAL